ncbi:MAG: hypothetical protein OEZ01_00530 [Candidatus Heimdallarchaeota archaeon]|nr:hypothetical protein [Candidatus Heimdallarchaeota archaeon]MDH5676620.1 hypothetical protein [Myxococcales bacterium]
MKHKGTYQARVRQQGDTWVATGCLRIGDIAVKATARISASAISRAIDRAAQGFEGVIGDEIGWGFFRKIKRAASKVAKRIAQSKALGKIAKVARNPAFLAALSVVPGVGPVAAGTIGAVATAYGGLQAAYAQKRGDPQLARRISAQNAQRAKRLGISPARFNRAQRYGARLAVDPRLLTFLGRGPQGGGAALLQSLARNPPPGLLRQFA